MNTALVGPAPVDTESVDMAPVDSESVDTAPVDTQRGGSRRRFGRLGEEAAAAWYRHSGYAVLAANWRCPEGEIDLIVSAAGTVAFVEVKARTTGRYGTGAEAVDWRKQQKVRSVARHWLAQQDQHYPDLRFDVVDVDGRGTLQVHTGCF